MTLPRATVDIVAIGDDLETLALRSVLEYWGIRVTLHLIGQAKDLVSVLGGEQPLAATVFLMCHGDDRGILLPELGTEIEAEQPYHRVITPADVRAFVRVPECAIINTGCATGTPALAEAFLDAGSRVYIGPDDYPNGDAALFYVLRLCYECICRGHLLQEAHASASGQDEQTGMFKMFERRT